MAFGSSFDYLFWYPVVPLNQEQNDNLYKWLKQYSLAFNWKYKQREWIDAAGGASWGNIYEWTSPTTIAVWWLPSWTDIDGRTVQDVIEKMTQISTNPSVFLRATETFWIYEIWYTISSPLIEWRGVLGTWPVSPLTSLVVNNWWTSIINQSNPVSNTWYSANDWDITTNTIYSATIIDDGWRSNSISLWYEFVYPWYATSSNITTLTKQALQSNAATYYEFSCVAESDTAKWTADFEDTETITWVEFYNSISWNRDWLWWNKAASLWFFDVSSVTHDGKIKLMRYFFSC